MLPASGTRMTRYFTVSQLRIAQADVGRHYAMAEM
jgi:hypothetical protein